ncbi:MAG: hypothetical protein GW808_02875 [Sphingomonadales bacterium]|nr:hypothetical protein [Sphingomonadales bacterium]NCO99342.1 hypothetical protein [Sphingomonadales bacterium]NCP42793.1 hypothetical protein [Sphingomonadales bacterium]NCP48137.1 hypothetical protein [Sphingomonadales bacterium]NCQ08116.1 hypothetical protein [Sphingomonadales bacterium]
MPKTNNLTDAMVGKILILNILFHVLSGIFTGVWIADLVAPTGEMTLLTWLETIMSAVAIAAGLSYGSYIALTHIPTLPSAKRKQVMGIFVAAYLAVAAMLGIASSSVLASASGEVAHMETALTTQTEATQARQRAAASLINRSSVMNDCVSSAGNMSAQEIGTGVYSGEGGNMGQVATALTNISEGCANARATIFASRAKLERLFFRIDRLLIDTRRVIDSNMERHEKMVAVRKNGENFTRLTREVNDALPVEAVQAVADAMRKDWLAAGLPPSAAAAITHNFDGMAEELTEGLDDIAALKEEAIPTMPVVSNMAYLALYPEATIAAIAVGACIELIPLGGILLGFVMVTQKGAGGGGGLPKPAEPPNAPRRVGRPRKT